MTLILRNHTLHVIAGALICKMIQISNPQLIARGEFQKRGRLKLCVKFDDSSAVSDYSLQNLEFDTVGWATEEHP